MSNPIHAAHPLLGKRVTVTTARKGDPILAGHGALAADVTYTGVLLTASHDGEVILHCPDIQDEPISVYPALDITADPPDLPVPAVPTTYTVCAVPPDDIGNHVPYEIQVERTHHSGTWAVRRWQRCLGADGEWDWEPLPSSREEDWLATHRFDLDTALRLAADAATAIVVNGMTAAQMTQWIEGHQLREEPA